jgi:septal ring factor EnvC (AmiA/AmiB activator)
LLLLAMLPAVAVTDAHGQTPGLEEAIDAGQSRAAALAAESARIEARIDALRSKAVATAKRAQGDERALTEIEETLVALDEEEAALTARLAARRGQMAGALMALQRLGMHPPDSLAAVRASPTDTVRGGLLLRAVIPDLRSRAADLGRQLNRLDAVRREITANRQRHETRLAALDGERADLGRMVEEMRALRAQTKTEADAVAQRNAALAAKAKDIGGLMRRLEDNIRAPAAPALKPVRQSRRSFAKARGAITPPAQGRVVQRFGEARNLGTASRGITMMTRVGAQVVAAYDGKIVFAGPFRGYGPVLIIEHSDGYHSLLAGLGRIDGIVGQRVLAGEPVGDMGDPDGGDPRLYIELRRDGQPINPSPWLAMLKSEEDG